VVLQCIWCFFFQAEDGIRDKLVTGVQTCALPICGGKAVIALPSPAIPEGESRRRLLHEYGRFIDSLGGLYSCAPDMNTSAADMEDRKSVVRERVEISGGAV